MSGQTGVLSIKIATGDVTTLQNAYASGVRLHPAGKAIFGTRGYSTAAPQAFDVTNGAITPVINGSPSGSRPSCGKVWFSLDGTRSYNGCATVFRHSDDPALDLTFIARLKDFSSVVGVAEHAASDYLAALAFYADSAYSPQNDGEVRLFDKASLALSGKLQLPPFTAGGNSYAPHGKHVFFDKTGSSLIVVMQADVTSGLLNDFAIQRYPLVNPATCAVTLDASTASAGASGSYATLGITAAHDCLYQAVSSSVWIQLVSGGYGTGNGTLTYMTKANSTTVVRSGTITVQGRTLTITQAAAPATPSTVQQIPYKVVDAEYDKALDRVVMVAAGPDELHLYDPTTALDQTVALFAPPLSVSVRPDGDYAAVGHSGAVSYVNLKTLAVEQVFAVPEEVNDIVLAANGWIYTFPGSQSPLVNSLRISSGAVTSLSSGAGGRAARVYSTGNFLYGAGDQVSKFDIRQGALSALTLSNTVNACNNLWLTEDGARLFTACATVARTSETPSEDLQANGSLSGSSAGLGWAAHSTAKQATAVIPAGTNFDTEVQIYGDAALQLSGRNAIPKILVDTTPYSSHGRFVFWNAASNKLFVVAWADNTTSPISAQAVIVMSPTDISSCTYTLSANSGSVTGAGGTLTVNVNTGAACVWNVSSSPTWVTRLSGNLTGSGTLQITVSPANTVASRTGTMTIAGKTYTITQDGVVPELSLIGGVQVFAGGTDSGYILVSTNATDYSWTATSNSSWLTLVNATGKGDGRITFLASANSAAASRTALITVGSQKIAVVQFGTSGVYGGLALTPYRTTIPAAGGSGAISVVTNPVDLGWYAYSNVSWITVTPATLQTGNAQVTYQVEANPFPSMRTAYLIVGNDSFEVTQAGSGTVTLNPSVINVLAAGATGVVNLTASSPNFAWSANSPAFVSLSPSSGTGNKQISYTIAQNLNATPRTITVNIADAVLTINQAGASPALRFVSVAPCRILDTRLPVGELGGPSLAARVPRNFNIPASACGIPSTAQVYSVNATVVPKVALSYLTLWPAGQSQPLVSTLNSFDGRIVANAALVPAGTNGAISMFATDDTDVVLDINGYFAPVSSAATLQFYPVAPCRVTDTRLTAGPFGGPTLEAGTSRDFRVPNSACAIPTTAVAYSLNMTVVPLAPLGYLTTWPTGQARPLVSTLNSQSGAIVANAAIVPAGANGAVSVFVTDKSDVVIDINGYFAPPGTGGINFYALSPCRVMDTRLAVGALGGPSLAAGIMRTVPVSSSNCGVPSTVSAVSLNTTVVPSGFLGYLTLWPFGQSQPLVSTLNSPTGAVTANAALVPASAGSVNVFATHLTELVLDINGYFAP